MHGGLAEGRAGTDAPPLLPLPMDILEGFERAAKDAGAFALDVEATGLNPRRDRLICISVAVGDKTWIAPFSPLEEAIPIVAARDWFNDHILNDTNLSIVIHNAKFDIAILRSHGFVVMNKIVDTMVCEWLVNEMGAAPPMADHGIFGLKDLIKKYFGEERPTFKEVKDLLFIAPKDFIQYARDDARDHWRLWKNIEEPALKKEGAGIQKLFYDMEMPLIPVLMEMESSGLFINTDLMSGLIKAESKKVLKLQNKVWKEAGENFNASSPEQMSRVLFDKLKIPPEKIPETQKSNSQCRIYSTNEKYLKQIRKKHKIVPLLEEFRKSKKNLDGFLLPLLSKARAEETCRIYPSFKQTGTKIGRLSSSNPNGQNLPREGGVRDCVCAPPGSILCVGDLNQVELRILAHQVNDPEIIQAYLSGGDFHKLVETELQVERNVAKVVNFGVLYGFSIPSLAQFLGVSFKKAESIYNRWQERFKSVGTYRQKVHWKAMKQGFVETLFGRRRRFFGVAMDEYALRQSFHFTISGSAADVIKLGMVNLHKELEKRRAGDDRYKKVKLLAQVHDELVLEAPEELKDDVCVLLKEKMEDVGRGRFRVPIIAEVGAGQRWTDAKLKTKKPQ